MALFESYLEPKTGYKKAITWSMAVAITLHLVLVLWIVAFPLFSIKMVPAPEATIGVFEAAPPPPPPPPPAGGAPEKPKEEKKKKPKEPDVIKEVEKVEKEIKKDTGPAPSPAGVQGGVEGGVAGGVVGGVVGGTPGGAVTPLPGKMISQAQKKVSGDEPVYPPAARAQGISATIVARVCISEVGAVTSIKILKGETGFNESVQGAVKGWRYEPYMANGAAVPACFPVYFNFNLKK